MEEEVVLKSEMAETNTVVKPKKNIAKIVKTIIFFAVILVIAGGVYYYFNGNSGSVSISMTERTALVSTQDLSTSITGSGSMISSNLMQVAAKTSGTIQKINYKQGDKVKKGAVICQLDTSDAESSVQNAQNNLDQAKLSQQQDLKNYSKLTVTAPLDGQITSINVNQGDIVQQNSVLYTITDNKHMILTVPFNGNDIGKIKVGETANINLQNIMQTIKGKVSYVGNAPYSTAQGGDLYNVEFAIENPGSLTEGIKASADVIVKKQTISSVDVGALSFANKVNVRTDTGGTADVVNLKLYQEVKKGQLLIKLTNQNVVNQVQSDKVKIAGLVQQLSLSKKQLTYCTITAPISGEITEVSNKEGETLKMGDVLTSITDVSHMQFTISVDELDIAKIKVGQSVNVTVDALTQTSTLPLIGKVKDVAVEGSASNGVTTYDVTIEITGVTDPMTLFSRYRNSGNGNGQGFSGGSGSGGSNSGGSGYNGRNGYGQGSGSGNGNGGSRNGYGQNSGNSSNGSGSRNGYGNGSSSGYGSGSGQRSGGFGGFSGMGSGSGSGSSRFSMFDTSTLLSSLKDGMNADAEIVIENYKNVTAVPLEAITRYKGQSYVMVKSDAATVAKLKKSGKYVDVFADSSATLGSTSSQSSGSGYGNRSSNGNSSSGSSRRNGYGSFGSGSASSGYQRSGYGNSSSSSMSSIRNSLQQYKEYYKNAIPTAVEVGVNNSGYMQILSGVKTGDVVLLPPLVTASKSSSSSSNSSSSFSMGLGGMGGGMGGGFPSGGGQFRNSGSGSGSSRSSSSRSGGGN